MLNRITSALFYLIMSIVGIYFFITFDDWMSKDFIDGAVDTKGRLYRSFLFILSQNKIGYWLVRGGIILGTTAICVWSLINTLKKIKLK